MNVRPNQFKGSHEPQPEKQTCGYIISVLSIISSVIAFIGDINMCFTGEFQFGIIFSILANVSFAYFHIMAISKPEYLKGKPSLLKLAPLFVNALFHTLGSIFIKVDLPAEFQTSVDPTAGAIIGGVIVAVFSYFMYGSDDESGSCWLCFKPWIHKRPVAFPAYNQYPHQGYPPQGYAPQAYAPQAYAPQGYAPQGYPNQGFVPQQAVYPIQGKPVNPPQV